MWCRVGGGNLCPEEVVGAAYSLSESVLVSNSREAASSPFVPIELASIQRLRAGEDEWYMMTPAEAIGTTTILGGGVVRVWSVERSNTQ